MAIDPHVDVIFPTAYRYKATRGGAEFSTTVIRTKGGKAYRNINWQQELQRWEVSFFDKIATIIPITDFHRARFGQAQSFLFFDHDDCEVEGGVIGTGDGSETEFPLKKLYTNGPMTYERLITKPLVNTIQIYLNGVLQPSGWNTSAVINTAPYTPLADGIITFSSPPGNGVVVTADFQFVFPVRFTTDYLPKSLDDHNVLGLDAITLVEERL